MAFVRINIHCTAVVARASCNNGTEWVTLAFQTGEETAEITLFFENAGAADLFAARVGRFEDDQKAINKAWETHKAAAPAASPEEEIAF